MKARVSIEQVSSDTDDSCHAVSINDHLSSHALGLVLHIKTSATLDWTHLVTQISAFSPLPPDIQ